MFLQFRHIAECDKCVLRADASQVVVGGGSEDAGFVIVGEAPGKDEDRKGEPFVGVTGTYLFDKLRLVGLAREMFYVTNVVKCRPPKNADPEPEEIAACAGHLRFQLHCIQPKLIVTVGRFALSHFCSDKISEVHGTVVETKRWSLFPLYHPSYALRKRKTVEPVFLEDIQHLKEVIVGLIKLEKEAELNLFSRRS